MLYMYICMPIANIPINSFQETFFELHGNYVNN